jgi:hypothetical protein
LLPAAMPASSTRARCFSAAASAVKRALADDGGEGCVPDAMGRSELRAAMTGKTRRSKEEEQ